MKSISRTKNLQDVSQILFFSAFGIYLLSEILSSTFYLQYYEGRPFWIIRGFWLLILVVREFLIPREYGIPRLIRLLFANIKWLVCVGILAVFAVAITLFTTDFTMCYILIFLFCARNIDFEKIAKFSFWLILITVVFVIVSAYAGIIENFTYVVESRNRHYLGFLYALYLPAYMLTLTALLLYFRKRRITWIELAALVAANVFVYLQSVSRLSFCMSLAMILVFAFLKVKPDFMKGKQVLCKILIFSFVICFTVSLVLALSYNDSSPAMVSLDKLLGTRLSLAHNSILNNGIHLFWQKLDMVGNGFDSSGRTTLQVTGGTYSYVDCIYVQFLLRNGIIFTILWFAFLTLTMYYFYRTENYYMIICLTFYALCGMIDDLTFRLYFNPFWIAGSWFLTRLMNLGDSKPSLIPNMRGNLGSEEKQATDNEKSTELED